MDNMDEIENQEEEADLRAELNSDAIQDYGAPTPEEKINQFTILKSAFDRKDTLRTTFLRKEELGKPMFSVRFYLGCESLCKMFNAPMIEEYFKNHVQNITGSGMSNEGFAMKLNVSNIRNVKRTHERKFEDIGENKAP